MVSELLYEGGNVMENETKLIDTVIDSHDTELTDMWKLGAFTDEVNKAFLSATSIEADYKTNTINNYFKDLEEKGIHIVQKINDVRVFDADDLKLAVFILMKRSKELNQQKTWGLKQIYDEIERSPELPNRKPSIEEQSKDNLKELVLELQRTFTKTLEESSKAQMLISTVDKNVEKKVTNAVLAYMEQQNKMKTEARAEWEKLPKEQRYTGFIFKQERIAERERFIDEYVEKAMYKWLLANEQNETSE